MLMTLTAYSEKQGKEWPVRVTIEPYKNSTNHRVVSAVMDFDGKPASGKLTERNSFHVTRFEGDVAKNVFGQREVCVKLREGVDVVKGAIAQMDEQAKAAQIAQLDGAGKLRYFIAVGGDTGAVSFGMCVETAEAGRYDAVTSEPAPRGTSLQGEATVAGAYLAGRFGTMALVSRARYEQLQGGKSGEAQAKQAKREAAKREEEAKFEQARTTGQRVELSRYTAGPCEEEGCMDDHVTYAMPDGSRKEERYHSY